MGWMLRGGGESKHHQSREKDRVWLCQHCVHIVAYTSLCSLCMWWPAPACKLGLEAAEAVRCCDACDACDARGWMEQRKFDIASSVICVCNQLLFDINNCAGNHTTAVQQQESMLML
jgi:hypothetical protein